MSFISLNKEDCDYFYDTKKIVNNKETYLHPLTNEEIISSDKKFKKIDKHCKSLESEKYIEDIITKWIKNPKKNPYTSLKIHVSLLNDSTYAKLYKLAYDHYKKLNFTPLDIKKKLPNNHLFLNDIDILFYNENKDTSLFSDSKFFYEEILYIIHQNPDVDYYGYKKLIISYIVEYFIDYIYEYLRYVFYLKSTFFDELSEYVAELDAIYNKFNMTCGIIQKFNMYSDFYKMLKNYKIHDKLNNKLLQEFDEDDIYEYDIIINNIINSDNVCSTFSIFFDELYYIYNYKNDPDNSPFINIDNKKFIELEEDPLISILKKIGIENLDPESLELPDRIFSNDEEYEKYQKRYMKIKNTYTGKMDTWRSTLDVNDKKTPTPPRHPTMKLPNGKILDVATQFLPYHIKDNKYNELVKTYNDNKASLNLYKKLVNVGILDLIKYSENPKSPQDGTVKYYKKLITRQIEKVLKKSNKLKDAPPLLEKDKQYFLKNVLDGNTEHTCNANIDIFTQKDFKESPLFKLQLIFQLHSEYGGKHRIDCFYAPNFYNHIVNKINNKLPITNPVTNAVLSDKESEKAINDIMKIMKILVPNIEVPYFIPPPYDNEYIIKHKRIYYNSELYYKIYTVRKIADVEIKIFDICVIPAEIKEKDTKSNDITSDEFLKKIIELFNNGSLMHSYVPPYYIEDTDGYKLYFKLGLHLNNYYVVQQWIQLSWEEKVKKFIHIYEELRNFI
jgi:hypothetical protein